VVEDVITTGLSGARYRCRHGRGRGTAAAAVSCAAVRRRGRALLRCSICRWSRTSRRPAAVSAASRWTSRGRASCADGHHRPGANVHAISMDYVSSHGRPCGTPRVQRRDTIDQAKRRFELDRVIKLSSNENRAVPRRKPWRDATLTGANLYADDDHLHLRARLSEPYGLRIENTILVTQQRDSADVLPHVHRRRLKSSWRPDVLALSGRRDRDRRDAGARAVARRRHDLDAMLAAVTPRTKA